MSLPIDFVASAAALECYETCPRRFQHHYLNHLPTAGPDPTTAARTRRGDLFHRLVLWHDLGLDTDVILQTADDPVLETQWAAYKSFQDTLSAGGCTVLHDQSLVARSGDFQVLAKIDALTVDPIGGVTIYDWKTSERPSPGDWSIASSRRSTRMSSGRCCAIARARSWLIPSRSGSSTGSRRTRTTRLKSGIRRPGWPLGQAGWKVCSPRSPRIRRST